MNERDTNNNKDPLPARDSVLAIEVLNTEGQKARKGASKRGDAEHHGKAELQCMTFIKAGEEEDKTRCEAT